jgi:hypothetical protein
VLKCVLDEKILLLELLSLMLRSVAGKRLKVEGPERVDWRFRSDQDFFQLSTKSLMLSFIPTNLLLVFVLANVDYLS